MVVSASTFPFARLPVDLREKCLGLCTADERMNTRIALAPLQGGALLSENVQIPANREGVDWKFLAAWRRRNGSFPTLSAYNRLKRISFLPRVGPRVARAEGWVARVHELYTEILRKQPGYNRIATPLREGIGHLLEVRNVWDELDLNYRCKFARGAVGCSAAAGILVEAALGVYSNPPLQDPQGQAFSRGQNVSAHSYFDSGYATFTTSILIGDALFAKSREGSELFSASLDQIFAGEADLEEFFAHYLPPPGLPVGLRKSLLRRLKQQELQEQLPEVLSTMFVLVGREQERERRMEVFFTWAERNIEKHPLVLSYLTWALAAFPTSLADKWYPRCLALIDQHKICAPPSLNPESFFLAQENFERYSTPFPWLNKEHKSDVLGRLLEVAVQTGHLDGLRAVLREMNRERLISYEQVQDAFQALLSPLSDPLSRKQCIEELIAYVGPKGLRWALNQLNFWERKRARRVKREGKSLSCPGCLRLIVQSLSVSREKEVEAAALCLLVERVTKDPCLDKSECLAVRNIINKILPEVNAMIRELSQRGHEKARWLLPKKQVDPLPAPGIFKRFWVWLRYDMPEKILTITELALFFFLLEFPKVFVKIFLIAGVLLISGGWKTRTVVVLSSVATAAALVYYPVACLATVLAMNAGFSITRTFLTMSDMNKANKVLCTRHL